MKNEIYTPIFELTRGEIVESLHFGAAAIVDSGGHLVAWIGEPQAVTFLRSTAKPFQALPLIEDGGGEFYNLSLAEIALMCASHSGTDEHVITVQAIQQKTGVSEEDLLCGIHPLTHENTAEALRNRGEKPTPNRHNCSGKHTAMLAYARMHNWPTQDYLKPDHPVQQNILKTFAEFCDLSPDQVCLGTDGCSAPNFAVPLRNAALAFARLCDPEELPAPRAAGCRIITEAMTSHPGIVGGPGRFDTHLMEVTGGRIVAKGGAEGYQGLGLMPGVLSPGAPALGIAIKISDGDPKGRALRSVALEILRQLGVLFPEELEALSRFGPVLQIHNWSKIVVGKARPCFNLNYGSP